MKALLILISLAMLSGVFIQRDNNMNYRNEFNTCSDGSDASCEICEILLDGKERDIIKVNKSEEGISVQFTEDGKEYGLDGLTENEYFTL